MSQPSSGPADPAIPEDHTITINPTPPTSPPPPPSTNSGSADPAIPANHIITNPRLPPPLPLPNLILGESRKEFMNVAIPLYKAAIEGDWKAAEPILKNRPELVRYAITENYDTLLHIAASTESTKSVQNFVKNLVDFMDKDDLELSNMSSQTALMLAAQAGSIETAKILLNKNPGLIDISYGKRVMPLYMAAVFEQPDMVRYLYNHYDNMKGRFWTDMNRGWVLKKCAETEIFDVAIKIINDWPQLTDRKGLVTDILVALAEKTHAFKEKKPNVVLGIIKSIFALFHVKAAPLEKKNEALQLLRIIWVRIAILPMREIEDIFRGPCRKVGKKESDKVTERFGYPSRVLFVATKAGNTRFIIELIGSNPNLIFETDNKGRTIFHLAIKHREINIYKLIYKLGAMKGLITQAEDNKGNNLLHTVGKKPKQIKTQNVSGAALEMQ